MVSGLQPSIPWRIQAGLPHDALVVLSFQLFLCFFLTEQNMDVGISGANLKPSGNESTMCTEEKQGLLRLKFRNRMTGCHRGSQKTLVLCSTWPQVKCFTPKPKLDDIQFSLKSWAQELLWLPPYKLAWPKPLGVLEPCGHQWPSKECILSSIAQMLAVCPSGPTPAIPCFWPWKNLSCPSSQPHWALNSFYSFQFPTIFPLKNEANFFPCLEHNSLKDAPYFFKCMPLGLICHLKQFIWVFLLNK